MFVDSGHSTLLAEDLSANSLDYEANEAIEAIVDAVGGDISPGEAIATPSFRRAISQRASNASLERGGVERNRELPEVSGGVQDEVLATGVVGRRESVKPEELADVHRKGSGGAVILINLLLRRALTKVVF